MRHRLFLSFVLALFVLGAPAQAQDTAAQIDELLGQYHDLRQFNGVALVAQNGEVIYQKGFGEADMSWDIPNTPDVKFLIGSVTKQFTAALILQLMEEGQIDLHAPITTYLPDYPKPQGEQVTVHHLLNHTSGIPSMTSMPGFMQNEIRDPYTPEAMVEVFAALDLEFEPGTEYRYNNSGYFLLGVIIETVAGKPYDVVLREQILEPLGLDDTGYFHYDEIQEDMATGYRRTFDGYARAAYFDSTVPYAAGMMYSTVGDLFKWHQALVANEVFEDAATLALMYTPGLDNYGYGWVIHDETVGDQTVTITEHGGGIFGFSTAYRRMIDEDNVIVVLDNTEGNPGAIAQDLTKLLYGVAPDAPVASIGHTLMAVIEDEGVEAAIARYHTLKEEAPDAYHFGEDELNRLGYALLQNGRTDAAIAIFELNVAQFPEAWNPYDSLGEAYLKAGNEALAIANYQKSLELNPGNAQARAVLNELGVDVAEEEVTVPAEVLERYVGVYELAPTFKITISRDGEQLFAQATGQPQFPIFPSSETRFYLKVVDAQLEFDVANDGTATGLTLFQNGREIPGPKVE